MELAFEQKQRSCLHRTAHLSLAQEQTQELIIPDSMPDASRTLICCAEPEVQSKTNREGSLLVTGTLRTGCLYADEAGGLQLLTSELPFTVKLECAELREDTQTLVRCCVRSADSRLINSRKVLLRVSVLVQADGYEPQTQSMSVLKDPPACLQLKTQTYETNAPVELSERAFQVSEELNLPDGRPQIARLVSCLLTPVVQEQGLVGSKAVLKGTANLQITYLDNENALRTLSFSVPFSQYCQMEGDYDQDETLESVLLVTGVQLEPVASEQSQKLLFGAGLLAQCMVVQPQALTLCEDAYSTKGEFQPQWETQEHTMRLDAQTLREPVRASFPVQAAAVLDCRVYPDAQALERTDDGVTVHVPLRADLVYTDPDGAVQAETFRTEVSCHTALSENGLCEAVCTIQPEGYASAESVRRDARPDEAAEHAAAVSRHPAHERKRRALGPCAAVPDDGAVDPAGQSSDAAGGGRRTAAADPHVRREAGIWNNVRSTRRSRTARTARSISASSALCGRENPPLSSASWSSSCCRTSKTSMSANAPPTSCRSPARAGRS